MPSPAPRKACSHRRIPCQVRMWSGFRESVVPDFYAELVKRVRLLTLTLLPVEADTESLSEVTSRIITKEVIASYTAAAGDFIEAVGFFNCVCMIDNANALVNLQLPYCLLRARKEFMWDANHSPADYDENYGRGQPSIFLDGQEALRSLYDNSHCLRGPCPSHSSSSSSRAPYLYHVEPVSVCGLGWRRQRPRQCHGDCHRHA